VLWQGVKRQEKMKVPLLDLKAQYAPIREKIRSKMDEICDKQTFILGDAVESFEKRVAVYCGTDYAIGMSSGTDAILAALMALGVGQGDGVITTPYTFFATAGCIARLGAIPVFADIDPATFNINPVSVRNILERKNKIKPKVLMPVHLFGQCADMESLIKIAREYGLFVVEDAAQAIGAEYKLRGAVKKAGSMGDIGCYSFFPSKNLGGFGDGGMAVTNNPELAEKLKRLRNHGMHPKYYHSMVGGNFRLDALQAAVLDIKLDYLESWHAGRRKNAEKYNKLFEGTKIKTPLSVYAKDGLVNPHIYNQYVVCVPRRDEVRKILQNAEIGHDVYYPVPLHLQECFKYLGYKRGDFPESETAAEESLALPVYPELTDEMIGYVANVLIDAVEGRK